MMLSDKAVQEFKDIYKKDYGVELSNDEARDYGGRLMVFVEILMKQAVIEQCRKKRLEKEPGGFCLEEKDGVYNCRVCYRSVSGEDAWWDLNGVKCLNCQRNIKEGVIPGEICQNDEMWIKDWELRTDYNIHSSTTRKLRREGLLHGRDLKTKEGAIYFTVYLVNENKEFLKKYPKNPKMKVKYIDPKGKETEI